MYCFMFPILTQPTTKTNLVILVDVPANKVIVQATGGQAVVRATMQTFPDSALVEYGEEVRCSCYS